MARPHILLIEDNPEEQQHLHDTLRQRGYRVSTISDPERALTTVEEWARQFHLIIIEEAMYGRSGLRLLHETRTRHRELPVVMVSRDADWSGYAHALSDGAADYIALPSDQRELLDAVEGALARAS